MHIYITDYICLPSCSPGVCILTWISHQGWDILRNTVLEIRENRASAWLYRIGLYQSLEECTHVPTSYVMELDFREAGQVAHIIQLVVTAEELTMTPECRC